jgi:DNA-binding response OmpR family regulator
VNPEFTVGSAISIKEAQKILLGHIFDVFVVDLGLPDGDGLIFLEYLSEQGFRGRLPILVLTGYNSPENRIKCFERGADDFIAKPFIREELKARILSKITTFKALENGTKLVVSNFELDLVKQTLKVREPSKIIEIELTSKEVGILCTLLKHFERTVDRDKVMSQVWGTEVDANYRKIDTLISQIRTKLGNCSLVIESEYGKGYYATKRNSQSS